MRTLSMRNGLLSTTVLTALLFLAGCSAFEFQLTASPEPGVAEPTPIPAPAAGMRFEVVVEPGQTVCLDVPDLKDARVVARDDGLLIVLPNGGEIFLANFRPDPKSELPVALCLAGGLGGIAPAAGPGVPDDDPLARDGGGGGDGGNDSGNDGGNDGGNDDGDGDGDGDGDDGDGDSDDGDDGDDGDDDG